MEKFTLRANRLSVTLFIGLLLIFGISILWPSSFSYDVMDKHRTIIETISVLVLPLRVLSYPLILFLSILKAFLCGETVMSQSSCNVTGLVYIVDFLVVVPLTWLIACFLSWEWRSIKKSLNYE